MLLKTNRFAKSVLIFPRFVKKCIVIIVDVCSCIISTWLAFSIRLENFIVINEAFLLATIVSVTFALPIFWFFGLYKILIHRD